MDIHLLDFYGTNIVSLDFIPTGITRGSKSTLSEYKDSKAISMEFLANPANKLDIIKETWPKAMFLPIPHSLPHRPQYLTPYATNYY